MQQEGEAGDMNRNNNKQGEAQQPQKCPRCDSLNTKFCYYNNYSLSQPRYFCKSCRRYWTQGGTLRNVRVGGGCRKPKRVKTSASSTSSSSADTHPPPPPQQDPLIQKDTPSAVQGSPAPPISPFSGYLSSLAGMNPSQPLDQMGGASNLGLLSGFYEMGIMREREELESSSLFETEQGLMIQSSTTPHTGGHDWTVTHNHNGNQRAGGSDASTFWSTAVTTTTPTTTSGNSESTNPASFISLIPNHQWPHLPGYHPPP